MKLDKTRDFINKIDNGPGLTEHTKSELFAEIAEFEKQFDILGVENERLRNYNRVLQSQFDSASDNYARSITEKRKLQDELDELKKKYEKTVETNRELSDGYFEQLVKIDNLKEKCRVWKD